MRLMSIRFGALGRRGPCVEFCEVHQKSSRGDRATLGDGTWSVTPAPPTFLRAKARLPVGLTP